MVGHFDIGLVDHCILKSSIQTLMTEQVLDLLDRHTLVNGHCCQCPSELMWMYLCHVQSSTNLSQSYLNAAYLQPFMWSK